ncbi:hypothetical protein PoB_002853000 [Plakobranchus ocellatus]|uniref:Uncharacterized protein n=1 Tax=Plakobranchus ocellatus TaxID=259542 RepID=A0AAV4A5A3_9GAST|nr:hypothetical protein PoB_002853000 [Plakobranchus ocellatus]
MGSEQPHEPEQSTGDRQRSSSLRRARTTSGHKAVFNTYTHTLRYEADVERARRWRIWESVEEEKFFLRIPGHPGKEGGRL